MGWIKWVVNNYGRLFFGRQPFKASELNDEKPDDHSDIPETEGSNESNERQVSPDAEKLTTNDRSGRKS